jgi:hypothetical protein
MSVTDRDSIAREAAEAEAELAAIKAEMEKKEAEKQAATKGAEPLATTSIEDIFPEVTTADAGKTELPGITSQPNGLTETPQPNAENAALKAELEQLKADLAKADQRFQSTFGNYNKAGFAALNAEIEALKTQLAEKTAAPAVVVPDADLEELTGEVGAKGANLIVALKNELASVKQQLADVTGQVKTTGEKAGHLEARQAEATTRMLNDTIDKLAPNWRKYNGDPNDANRVMDPRFVQFIDQTIPGTDRTYNDMLIHHYSSGNASKVAEVFSLFEKSLGSEGVAGTGTDMVAEPDKKGGGTPTPQPKPEKRIYTQAEIDRFDALNRAGKLKATQEQIDAIEADIQQAILDGRVRG